MKTLATLAFILAATTAQAKDINLPMADSDQQTFLAALDALTKAGGLNVCPPTAVLYQKWQEAVRASTDASQAPKGEVK